MGCTWGGVLYGFRTKNNLSTKYVDRFGKSTVPAASAARADKRDTGTLAVPDGSATAVARGD